MYIGKAPRVYDYIKTWGSKVIIYIIRESLPRRQDKFIPPSRESIFIGYNEYTTVYKRVYIPDIYITIILSNIKFYKDLPGSSIKNY